MRYAIRVVIGVVLGLAAAVALHFFLKSWWVTGTIGAIFALVGFLGSFFLWSADRPAEGYEQVLFDVKNNVVSLALIAIVLGAAFGLGHLGGKSAASPVDPAVATMNTQHDKLVTIYNEIQGAKLTAAQVPQARTDVKASQAALGNLTSDSPKLPALQKAATALLAALDAYSNKCGDKLCQAATLALLDAKTPLDAYRAA